MKTFIASVMVSAFSAVTLANTIDSAFLKDSVVPTELKIDILDFLAKNCSQGISAYGLNELNTVVTEKARSNGLVEKIYVTNFSTRYYADRYHPSTDSMVVTSSDLLGALEVDSLACN